MRKVYQKPQTTVYDFQATSILCMSGYEDLYKGPFGQVTDGMRSEKYLG